MNIHYKTAQFAFNFKKSVHFTSKKIQNLLKKVFMNVFSLYRFFFLADLISH